MKIDIEELVQPIKKGAAIGFLTQLVMLFLLTIYSFIATHSPFNIITRQGVLVAIEYSFILWTLLYIGASMFETAIKTVTGEEHPTVEYNNLLKGFIIAIIVIYLLVLYKLVTTVSIFTLAGFFLELPVLVAIVYTIDKFASLVF